MQLATKTNINNINIDRINITLRKEKLPFRISFTCKRPPIHPSGSICKVRLSTRSPGPDKNKKFTFMQLVKPENIHPSPHEDHCLADNFPPFGPSQVFYVLLYKICQFICSLISSVYGHFYDENDMASSVVLKPA